MHSTRDIVNKIAERRWEAPVQLRKMTGGDINEVYRVTGKHGDVVIKLNSARRFPGMFHAEAEGLKALLSTGTFKIPIVLGSGQVDDTAYLILEYIAPGTKNEAFWEHFGRLLADLHRNSEATFGFHMDNYIGSLPQPNDKHERCSKFYMEQRLLPQFRLAAKNGYTFDNLQEFKARVDDLIPEQRPALLHGDLWNGNYLTSQNQEPVLIDPAVSYGPREMDLAMMDLFGGFPPEVFDAYRESFPVDPGYEDRRPLWQLYYLLVHLNLFGSGYLGQVQAILDRYC